METSLLVPDESAHGRAIRFQQNQEARRRPARRSAAGGFGLDGTAPPPGGLEEALEGRVREVARPLAATDGRWHGSRRMPLEWALARQRGSDRPSENRPHGCAPREAEATQCLKQPGPHALRRGSATHLNGPPPAPGSGVATPARRRQAVGASIIRTS